MRRLEKPPILFENKEYKANIDKDEIAKFIRDIDVQNVNGIFISQYSGIAFKQNYQIDVHKGNVLVYIQNCEYSLDKIRIAVDIIDSLAVKIKELNIDDTNNISKEMLDDINSEYQAFILQKENMIMMLKDFQKRMTSQIEDLKMPVLDKYLEPKYAYVKSNSFVCDLCNTFNTNNKQSLSAHKRGCKKKFCQTNA
jgi:transposase